MKRSAKILALAAGLTAIGGAAAGQDSLPAQWSRPVQPDLAERLYPDFASFLGESGRVLLSCPIEEDGHPFLCEVLEEVPAGLGFGAAARVMVASAEVKASRVDGVVAPSSIRTTVRFRWGEDDAPFGGWTGPEPAPAALALAREMIDEMLERGLAPPPYRDDLMGGLDHDRREVVGAWLDELFPRDEARQKETSALQIARLFGEDGLRRIRAGEPVDWPSEEEFDAACPDPTPDEQAAMDELHRRYCDRYECGVDPLAAPT
ncbi:MAG: energy transducer TonB [Pseudomonadota bacterium]|nr:energy transducer TonB [Pseudomonadota bacterium]